MGRSRATGCGGATVVGEVVAVYAGGSEVTGVSGWASVGDGSAYVYPFVVYKKLGSYLWKEIKLNV